MNNLNFIAISILSIHTCIYNHNGPYPLPCGDGFHMKEPAFDPVRQNDELCFDPGGNKDKAKGYPTHSGNIGPGQRVYFDAVCFNLQSHDQVRSYEYEITYRRQQYKRIH
jgi:hypothetical protein